MGRFTVRVELHDADDYTLLHEEMKQAGFTQTIRDSQTGETFQLPTAEYNYIGTIEDKHQIIKLAHSAATQTGKKFMILVTKSAGRTWTGLEDA